MACFQRISANLQRVSTPVPVMVQLSKTKAQVLTISAPLWHDVDDILGDYGLFSTKLYQFAVGK